jgi:hypothetical protein
MDFLVQFKIFCNLILTEAGKQLFSDALEDVKNLYPLTVFQLRPHFFYPDTTRSRIKGLRSSTIFWMASKNVLKWGAARWASIAS